MRRHRPSVFVPSLLLVAMLAPGCSVAPGPAIPDAGGAAAPAIGRDPSYVPRPEPFDGTAVVRGISVPALVRQIEPILLESAPSALGPVTQVDPPPLPRASRRPIAMRVDPRTHSADVAPEPAGVSQTDFNFASTNFDNNATYNSSFLFIPPDPHLAAGPDHVVTVVNCVIQFHNKTTGASVYIDDLAGFFAAESPATFTFDPKVIYDEFEDRWVVVTLEFTDTAFGDPTNTSKILLAVSDDSDPTGTWYTTTIDTFTTIGAFDYWFDYPGFAVDEEAVYITGNLFRFFSEPSGGAYGGGRLVLVDKGVVGGFYSGAAASATILDPFSGSAVPSGVTLQPAHLSPSAPAGSVGTFIVAFSGLTLGGGIEAIGWMRVDDPVGSPALASGVVSLGVDTGSAQDDTPQFGSATLIDTGDRRTLSAVYRKKNVWLTSTTMPAAGSDAADSTAFWVRLDVSNTAAPALGEFGYLGAEDLGANTFTSYAGVAVNSGNHALFGFSGTSAARYASAYFAWRVPEDAAGTVGATKLLEDGTDYYVRTFGGGRNRWGDYSGAVVDPVDGCFWVYNEYAMTRGTATNPPPEDGRWATSVGKVCTWIFGDDFERGDLTFRWSAVSP